MATLVAPSIWNTWINLLEHLWGTSQTGKNHTNQWLFSPTPQSDCRGTHKVKKIHIPQFTFVYNMYLNIGALISLSHIDWWLFRIIYSALWVIFIDTCKSTCLNIPFFPMLYFHYPPIPQCKQVWYIDCQCIPTNISFSSIISLLADTTLQTSLKRDISHWEK